MYALGQKQTLACSRANLLPAAFLRLSQSLQYWGQSSPLVLSPAANRLPTEPKDRAVSSQPPIKQMNRAPIATEWNNRVPQVNSEATPTAS